MKRAVLFLAAAMFIGCANEAIAQKRVNWDAVSDNLKANMELTPIFPSIISVDLDEVTDTIGTESDSLRMAYAEAVLIISSPEIAMPAALDVCILPYSEQSSGLPSITL